MAQNAATLRLMSDLREMQKDAPEGASAAPMNEDNIFVWTATIFGPADTPWEGGIFSLRMTFCDQYPDKPPKVFLSDLFFLMPWWCFQRSIAVGVWFLRNDAGSIYHESVSSKWYVSIDWLSDQSF
jgi:hypothetical protein